MSGSLERNEAAPLGAGSATGRPVRPVRAAVLVGLVGIVITASLVATSFTLDRDNEHRLLEVQTRQAGDVLAATILSIQNPLVTALQIEGVTGGSPQQFARFMASYVGPGRLFVTASLWRFDGTSIQRITSVGGPTSLDPSSVAAHQFLLRAVHSPTFAVHGIPSGRPEAVGYAMADAKVSPFVVYAERAIPANRRVSVEQNSAFADLYYATYLGSTTRSSELATTNVPPSALPLSGATARVAVPFGDTTLTLVASPIGKLGGAVGSDLPWIILVGGTLLTTAAAVVVDQILRRRREAEEGAETVSALYGQLDLLYGEQRSIAEALQRALLPRRNPTLANLEIATRYIAGAEGVDIGGDWYSLAPIDDRHFAFAVGDVSGRGISAATIMARLRFTIGAYLLEGHAPEVVLEMCSRQVDVSTDGHIVTAIVGIGDLETRQITVANAGHLDPLVVSETGAQFLTTVVGLPLGVRAGTYTPASIVMPPDSMFLAFTDGLVERRGEVVDVGLDRLAAASLRGGSTLESLVTDVVEGLVGDAPTDDIAVLAFRWRPVRQTGPGDQAAVEG